MDSWHAYGKIYNIGHKYIDQLFDEEVLIEEKVDGSQFSFGKFDGKIRVRSRGREFDVRGPDNMFADACRVVLEKADSLGEGYTYRGEYLRRPKHNALSYDRTPDDHIMIFDIARGYEDYMSWDEKHAEAARLGFETVPYIFQGKVKHAHEIFELLDRVSVLGGQKIEGLVVKSLTLFGRDAKPIRGKHVSEKFREIHTREWTKDNPSPKHIVQEIIAQYRTDARWHKAVQHLKEAGTLQNAPEDIGRLLKELNCDFTEECKTEIMEKLWSKFGKEIRRGIAHGFPEWYKTQLVEGQFGD